MKIEISKLRIMTDQILNALKERGEDFVEIPRYFWDVVGSDRYDMEKPPEPRLRNLSDDWSEIRERPSESFEVPALIPLSNVIRAVSDNSDQERSQTVNLLPHAERLTVEISGLRERADGMLKRVLDDLQVYSVEIPTDSYWDVRSDARYKPGDPPKPVLGSLSDDWNRIRQILSAHTSEKTLASVQVSNSLRVLGDHLRNQIRTTPTKKPRGIYRAYSEDVYESPKSEELETESAVAEARYANVCLTEGEARVMVPQKMQLGTSRDYQLRLDIGPLSSDSVVTNAEQNPFRADLLARSDDGHWLQVVAASDEFSIEPVPYNLFLPVIGPSWVCNCAPGGKHSCDEQSRSDHLFIPTKAPDKAGTAHVRIALYFLKNLVQSQLLTAEVSDEPQLGSGYSSSIDYSLTANLQDVGFLPQRTVNILTDQVADGASKLVINCGGDTAINLPLPTEGRVRTALDLVRKALSDIHFEEYGGQLGAAVQHRNLYDPNNSKSKEEFIEDLRKLAPVGYELYDSLFWDGNKRKALEAALNQTNVQIQISRPKDTSLTFPWALMYGIPLESDPSKHKLCGVLADWNGRAFSGNPSVCPHEAEHEPNTVCPFGFWGYRYIIEHPPSFERELPDKIPSGSKEMKIVVGRSTKLEQSLVRRI